MITAYAPHWSNPRLARHASTQPLDIDVDLDDLPASAEVDETVFSAYWPYPSETELANLQIGAQSQRYHSGPAYVDVPLEILPRPEPSSAAFRELDELRSDDRLARRAIRLIAETQIPYRDELAARLERLLRAYQEDYEGRSLSATSINAFVCFLNEHPCLKRPSVTATPSGDLYAEWSSRPDMLLGVRFMPSSEVQYVLFTPNSLHKGRTDRSSGSTTADALMERTRLLPSQEWLTNEG